MNLETQRKKSQDLAQSCATKAAEAQKEFENLAMTRMVVGVIETIFALICFVAGVWVVAIILGICAAFEFNTSIKSHNDAQEMYAEYMRLRDDCLETLDLIDQHDHPGYNR